MVAAATQYTGRWGVRSTRLVGEARKGAMWCGVGLVPAILGSVNDEGEWSIYVVDEVLEWINQLGSVENGRVVRALDALAAAGPGLGRPLVDTIQGSVIANLKELRPGTIRILFVFDPWRSSILLVAGDKSGQWQRWYDEAIPLAEQRYHRYLKERDAEEGDQR